MNRRAGQITAHGPAATPVHSARPRKMSVVMVVYMTGTALFESVASVLADPRVDEFVIVDNGSLPQDLLRLKDLAAREPKISLVSGQGNVGFARGANLGARASRGDLIVFLNPDAFLQANCLTELGHAIEGRTVPSLVGGRVLNMDLTEQRGARRGDITLMSALMSLSHLAKKIPAWSRYEVHWETEATPDSVAAVPTISGACFCMRREDFDAVQGFDEGYFLHVEDVDLCWRVRRAGGQVLFAPKAEVIHVGHTSQASPIKVEYYKGVGLARYFRKRAETVSQTLLAWLLSPVIVVTAVARPVMWRVRGRTA